MGKCKIWILSVLMICLLVGCSSTKEDAVKNDPKRNEAWIEDIDYLTSTMEEGHPNLFHNNTEEEYRKKLEELKKEVPNLTDTEINFKMKEIVSLIGDAHTNYNPNMTDEEYDNQKVYHMGFAWFEDELRITNVNENYRDILGMKLVGINDIPINEVIEKIGTIISYENKEWLKYKSLYTLVEDDALVYLGISEGGKVEYNLEDDNGNKINKTIKTISMMDAQKQPMVSYIHTLENRATPIVEEKVGNEYRPYWYKFVSKDSIFYFRYEQCIDKSKIPQFPEFDKFAKGLIESLNKNIDNIDKLVVDVRGNTGGRDDFMRNLSSELRKTIGKRDIEAYIITNRGTFSSGVSAIFDLKKDLNVTVVGSETGGNLITYGNYITEKSPNGNGEIDYSKNYYSEDMYENFYKEGPIKPDVNIKESFESYKNGIDDCYEYIKNTK